MDNNDNNNQKEQELDLIKVDTIFDNGDVLLDNEDGSYKFQFKDYIQDKKGSENN